MPAVRLSSSASVVTTEAARGASRMARQLADGQIPDMQTSFQPGRPNAGTGDHGPGRDHNPTVAYELRGSVRWVERDGDRFVLQVTDTNSHAGRFRGSDVTVEAAADRRSGAELLPGADVRVKANLPRDIDAAPEVLSAARVTIEPAAD